MSHNIEIVDGVAHIAYSGETPWHGLGTEVPNDLTPEQMLQAAKLDWTVSKVPAFVTINDKQVETGHNALVRSSDDSILDIIPDDWKPCQNSEAFAFFDDFVSQGDMSMECAGSLKDGRIVWALAKVNDGFSLFGGKDAIESYLLFTNPHTYGKSIDVRPTSTRVVCNNTLTLALSKKSKKAIKVSHRRDFIADEVKMALGCTRQELEAYREGALHLTSKRYTAENAKDYFRTIFPSLSQKDEKKDELSLNGRLAMSVLDTQPGVELGQGTWWQLFNSVSYINTHLAGRSDENRLESQWYGAGARSSVEAFTKALEMAV